MNKTGNNKVAAKFHIEQNALFCRKFQFVPMVMLSCSIVATMYHSFIGHLCKYCQFFLWRIYHEFKFSSNIVSSFYGVSTMSLNLAHSGTVLWVSS